ncbi:MAG: transcriptional repressor LexA [Bacillota bacterium]|nr:transcriptional repressor LexA [Bacillota bacterium]
MRSKNPDLMVQIMEYIDDYYSKYCSSPSVRTIAAGVGISRSTVQRYLVAMNEDGMLSYDGKELITDKIRKTNKSTVNVAVVGSIACGIPNLAEENIEEYVSLPKSMFGEGEFFILRANGESMVDAGIETGDLVVIRKQSCAEDGQIVVALVDDEATLKRLYRDNEKIRLHPENKDMDDIIADDCIIQGIAVKVIKDIH